VEKNPEAMMNNKNELQTRKFFTYIIILVIWAIISAFLLVNFTPALSLLGIALNVFVMVLSLTDLFRFAPWAGMLLSIATFTGAGYSLLNLDQDFLISTVVGAIVFIITAVICATYANHVRKVDEKYARLQQVADSLMIYDRSTSLMRWKFARQTLTTEILRGRRYNNDVTLVLFEYRNRDQFTRDDIRRINQVVSEILQEGIRTNLDIAFINDHLGLILPETGTEGALILTRRLVQQSNRRVDARLVAGISSFPSDAITEEEIIENAKMALNEAIHSEQSVMDYHTVRIDSAVGQGGFPVAPSAPLEQQASQQDYVSILENIDLDKDEWVVWVEGFNKMEDLAEVEHRFSDIPHIDAIDFLFLQKNHLVVKIKSTDPDLLESNDPFPGWDVLKNSPENRYWLLAMTEAPSQEDQS
jgi:GGDEF domain-containing protein